MDPQIGRETLLAIAAVGWADGKLDPREAAALKSAARHVHLTGQDLADVEHALSSRVTLDRVETVRMARLTRLFTYAAAFWIVAVDCQESDVEARVLSLLGDRLGLSAIARERAQSAVKAVAAQTRAMADAFDFIELRSRLSAGLSQIGDE